MKSSLLFLALLTLLLSNPSSSSSSSSSGNDEEFEAWCKKYDKSYGSEGENILRRIVFAENHRLMTIYKKRDLSYEISLNCFADITSMELIESRLGLGYGLLFDENLEERVLFLDGNVPSEIDWREKGAVTDVKDQGSCGSSWAFSAIGAIEGINKIKTGKLISLSEQELIDCNNRFTSRGCSRGQVSDAFQFVIENNGINTDGDYPYQARDMVCNQEKASKRVVTIDSFEYVPIYNEEQLMLAVARQPVSAIIPAGCFLFQFYSKGIFTDLCYPLEDYHSLDDLDHAVLIVGYGSENGTDYWILKNSWGKNWGMDGYMYLRRNHMLEGHSDINLIGLYPIKTSENPPHPGPVKCDTLWQCKGGETCCCLMSFRGQCNAWTCCDNFGVCCNDRKHCCPTDHPICDTERKLCFQAYGNSSVKAFEGNGAAKKYIPIPGAVKPRRFLVPFYPTIPTSCPLIAIQLKDNVSYLSPTVFDSGYVIGNISDYHCSNIIEADLIDAELL